MILIDVEMVSGARIRLEGDDASKLMSMAAELMDMLDNVHVSFALPIEPGVPEGRTNATRGKSASATVLDASGNPMPTLERCRTCQSYRANHGESDNGAVMEYCNKDGLCLLADGQSCGQFRHQTH
jgi:hypothetical protein